METNINNFSNNENQMYNSNYNNYFENDEELYSINRYNNNNINNNRRYDRRYDRWDDNMYYNYPDCDRNGRCVNPMWWMFWPFFFF